MMTCLVPLAGPDFIRPDGSLKPMFEVEGEPLLVTALRSRPWFRSGESTTRGLVFVIREAEPTASFREFLQQEFPGCRVVTISHLTQGALFSAMAGAALLEKIDAPVCVDLVDILYNCDSSPLRLFEEQPDAAGIIPYFPSNKPKFSYLKIIQGRVKLTVEKQVISNHASAGTYFFRDAATFLEAVAGSLRMDKLVTWKDAFFLCPAYNALTLADRLVLPLEVRDVQPVSEWFHLE